MDVTVLENESKRLFGGATIDVKPYSDAFMSAWDITIIPKLDQQKRFIRVSTAKGLPEALNYLKKIQQNLLNLQKKGAFGIRPIEEEVDQSVVEKAIEKKMGKIPNDSGIEEYGTEKIITKEIYTCIKCQKSFNYPGPFAMHKKKCEPQV